MMVSLQQYLEIREIKNNGMKRCSTDNRVFVASVLEMPKTGTFKIIPVRLFFQIPNLAKNLLKSTSSCDQT